MLAPAVSRPAARSRHTEQRGLDQLDAWPNLRAVPEAAGVIEVAVGCAARCPPPVPQHSQLTHLDAHVPLVRPSLLYNCPRQPRPPGPVTQFLLLRPRVPHLNRALVREPAIVAAAVVHLGSSFQEPSGQRVLLSLAGRVVAMAAIISEAQAGRQAINGGGSGCQAWLLGGGWPDWAGWHRKKRKAFRTSGWAEVTGSRRAGRASGWPLSASRWARRGGRAAG